MFPVPQEILHISFHIIPKQFSICFFPHVSEKFPSNFHWNSTCFLYQNPSTCFLVKPDSSWIFPHVSIAPIIIHISSSYCPITNINFWQICNLTQLLLAGLLLALVEFSLRTAVWSYLVTKIQLWKKSASTSY